MDLVEKRMTLEGGAEWRSSATIVLISAILVFLSFLLQGNRYIDLADEGFLWYGAWRMLFGEIPMRDFQAYDPGRYVWGMMWFMLLGDHGLISLRIANALFQFVGLTFGLLSLKRVLKPYWQLILAGVVLSLWLYPSFKVYDHGISLAGVYFAVLLTEKPNLLRHFVVGLFVGIAAFFGRNHGVYLFLAYFLLILLVRYKLSPGSLPKRLLVWMAGIVAGYSPILFMGLMIPGFPQAFWESIMFLFNYGSTNIAVPVPWPWKIHPLWVPPLEAIHHILVSLLFLMMPLFYILSFMYVFTRNRDELKQNVVFVAATFVGVFYAHYAFSRADLTHLALGIHPLLIGLMAMPRLVKFSRPKMLAVLGLYSLFSVGQFSPYFMALTENQVTLRINGDPVTMDKGTARVIQAITKINSELVKPTDQFLLAPNLTSLYPILERRSPTWDIYFLFPGSMQAQRSMIATLAQQNTNWVLVMDRPLDGRDDLRFKNTHPVLSEHLNYSFIPVEFEGLPSNFQLFKRK